METAVESLRTYFRVTRNFAELSGGSPSPVEDATITTTGAFWGVRLSKPNSLKP